MSGHVRVDYTAKDDDNLAKYLAKFNAKGEGRLGNAIYHRLVENADEKWPFARRHSWQSWRERYKRNKDEFDAKIRKINKNSGVEVEVEASTSSSHKIPKFAGSQKRDNVAVHRKASARKLTSEEPSPQELARSSKDKEKDVSKLLNGDEAEEEESDANINPQANPVVARNQPNEHVRNDSIKPPSREKRKFSDPDDGREAKRQKGKKQGVTFQDVESTSESTTADQTKEFITAVNYIMGKLQPVQLNHIQAILERRTESPSISAKASPNKELLTPVGKQHTSDGIGSGKSIREIPRVDVGPKVSVAVKTNLTGGKADIVDGQYQRMYPDLAELADTTNTSSAPAPAPPGAFPSQTIIEAQAEGSLFMEEVSEVPESFDGDVPMEDVDGAEDDGEEEANIDLGDEREEVDEVDELDKDDEGDFEEGLGNQEVQEESLEYVEVGEKTPRRTVEGHASSSKSRQAQSKQKFNDNRDDDYFVSPAASEKSVEVPVQQLKQRTTLNGELAQALTSVSRSNSIAHQASSPADPARQRQPVKIMSSAFRTGLGSGHRPAAVNAKGYLPDTQHSDTESEAEEQQAVVQNNMPRVVHGDWPPSRAEPDKSRNLSSVSKPRTPGSNGGVPSNLGITSRSRRSVNSAKPAEQADISTSVPEGEHQPLLRMQKQLQNQQVATGSVSRLRPGPSKLRVDDNGTDMSTDRRDFDRRSHRRTTGTIGNNDSLDAEGDFALARFRTSEASRLEEQADVGLPHGDVFTAPVRRRSSGKGKGKEREDETRENDGDQRTRRRQTFSGFFAGGGLLVPNTDLLQNDLRTTESISSGGISHHARRQSSLYTPRRSTDVFRVPTEAFQRRSSIASTIDLNSTFDIPHGEIPETDKQLIHRAGLTMFLKGMSENHGFREEVVWNVYNSRRDLVETDVILREMREEAEKVADKLLGGGSENATTTDNAKTGSEPKPSSKTLASAVSVRETRKRHSAPIPPIQNNLDFTPVRDEALLRRVRGENEEFSPPTTTRAATFSRLVGQGRRVEAIAREQRRTSHGGGLHPFPSRSSDGAVTSLFGSREHTSRTDRDVNAADPFDDALETTKAPERKDDIMPTKSTIPAESEAAAHGKEEDVMWSKRDDRIIIEGSDGNLARLEARKGKGSVKARTAQLIAEGKFF